MRSALLLACSVALLAACATEHHATRVVHGQAYCAKHRIPLITVNGFRAKPGVLVDAAMPRSVPCTERSPNRIWDSQNFTRDQLRPVPGLISYCSRCAAEFWQCEGGDHQLSDIDVQQITSLVSSRGDFRRPIIRVFAIYDQHAVAVGGREDRVGDVFTDVILVRRSGRWVISAPVAIRRVVAIGRPQSI